MFHIFKWGITVNPVIEVQDMSNFAALSQASVDSSRNVIGCTVS